MTIPQVTINKWLKKYGYLPEISFYGAKRLDSESTVFQDAKDKLSLFYDDPDDLETIILTPRCGHPDFNDPELELSQGFTGGGSWKKGCIPEYQQYYGAIVNWDTTKIPEKISEYFDEALRLVYEADLEIGFLNIFKKNAPIGAHMLESFSYMGGRKIGFHYFPTPNSCNRIKGQFDTSWTPSSVYMWARLVQHELGHAKKLSHVGGNNVMSPSIKNLGNKITWIGDASYKTLIGYFDGRIDPNTPNPIPPKPNPPKPTPPEPKDPRDGLLERILERIRERLGFCAKTQGVEETTRRIKTRGIRERIQLRRIIREEVPKDKQKEIYKGVLAEWYAADDTEIATLTEFLPDKFEI